jgi:hypothetical protein
MSTCGPHEASASSAVMAAKALVRTAAVMTHGLLGKGDGNVNARAGAAGRPPRRAA